MSIDNTRAADPSREIYSGNASARVARRLFDATRPKFFPASVLPVVAGTAWGVAVAGSFDAGVFLLALLATVCVHAGANVLNDVGDHTGGTDGMNEDRIYPYTGGSRFIQTGIMSPSGMARLGISLLAVAAIAGLLLLLIKGLTVLWLGLAGVALAVLYSLGPLRLSSLGLGEIAVGVGFGVLPVTGAAWLQSGSFGFDALVFSLPISAWVANILLINEVPDIRPDGATGKRTLPVRFGLGSTTAIYLAGNLLAAGAALWLTIGGALPLLAPAGPLALLLLAARAAGPVRRGIEDREGMTRAIETTLAIHTLGSLWLTGAVLYAALVGG